MLVHGALLGFTAFCFVCLAAGSPALWWRSCCLLEGRACCLQNWAYVSIRRFWFMAVRWCSALRSDSWGLILQCLWWSRYYGDGIICYDFPNQLLIILKYCQCMLLSWLRLRTWFALKLKLKLKFWDQSIRLKIWVKAQCCSAGLCWMLTSVLQTARFPYVGVSYVLSS